MYVIYDIETVKNSFLVVLEDFDSGKQITYKISDYRNDWSIMVKHWKSLIKRNYYFVGFNNIGFDAQVMEFILQKERTAEEIYNEAQRVINLPDELRWQNTIPEWKLSFKNIDLYLIKGFNSNAKRTSLKFLEFNFRLHNIEEIPINHWDNISEEEEKLVEEYCRYDIFATRKALEKFMSEVIARQESSASFGINLDNAAEPKMVKKIFISELCKELGITKDEMLQRRDLYKAELKPFKVTLPKYLRFNDEKLKQTYNFYENLLINPHNTKGAVNLSYRWHGIEIVHGLGGLHASINPAIIESSENWIIHDLDFTSFYPFLKIRNKLYPTYLSEKYLEIYEGFYHKRKQCKKGTPLNYAYKILLNSSYGLLNEANSPIYCPEAAINVTVIGQLTLLMLVEKLVETCKSLKLIQLNTDGVTLKYPVEYKERIIATYQEFAKLVQIEIEDVYYRKMIIQDVNNYISIDIDGKSKRKGIFEIYEDLDKTGLWNKNTSFNIIPLTLNAYFVEGKDIRKFIKSHTNIYDFCGAIKKKSDFDLVWYDKFGNKNECTKITRYFIPKTGSYLVKEYHDGRTTKVESKNPCQVLNKITDENALNYNLDYSYYIKKVEEIIFEIEGNQKQTTLF